MTTQASTKRQDLSKSATPRSSVSGDLHLAWQRLKIDHQNRRCFVTHPYLYRWIEADLNSWLTTVAGVLDRGYAPGDCLFCNEPKGGWMVRPGATLEVRDEIVFNAVLGHYHKNIWNAIGRSQGDPDVAYQFQRASKKAEWVHSGFPVWSQWRTKSLDKLRRNIRFVVFADIAGFYENIDLNRLSSDLRTIGFEGTHLTLLSACLKRWAHIRGKGIPQGYTASDLLAKLYLNSVDIGLADAGFKHLRYVDDIRIFCRNSLEAKRALLKLTELLRNRGLNLQSAKTTIARLDDARKKIDGRSPVIEAIQSDLSEELRAALSAPGSYATLAEIERAVASDASTPSVAVLEQAFADYFALSSEGPFDKTLFHYLLTRLGTTRSRIAVEYCLDLLSNRPEETKPVLRYLATCNLNDKEIGVILNYMESAEAIYDYQLYQLVEWFLGRTPPEKLVLLCRRWAFDRNREPWLRTASLRAVGSTGNQADLEKIESSYSDAKTELERAEIVVALERLETGRRNSFYNRVRADGEFVHRAIDIMQSRGKKGGP